MTTTDLPRGMAGADRVARALVILGQTGFWVQFVLLIAIALLGFYTFAMVGGRARTGNVLAFLGLALPVFTTFWCWRYARIGRALASGGTSLAAALRAAWIGVWAGATGIVVALLSLFGAASALLLVLLSNPQIGVQISPATLGTSAYTVSAVDAVSIMSLLLTLTAELLVVALSLRLVFLIAGAARAQAVR